MKSKSHAARTGGIYGSKVTRWVFVGPAMLVVICLLVYPLLSTLVYSFTNKTMIRPDFDVVGFQNYISLLKDEEFFTAFGHTLFWTVCSVLGQVIVGFIGALCLNRVKNNVAKNMFRIFAIIPWAFPAIATAMTWKWLLNGIYGFVPTMMKDLGLTEGLIQFLSNSDLVLPTLVGINIWFGAPLIMVNVYAALQTIPRDQYEAAQIDGANAWQSFRYVTAPHIRTVVGLLVVLRTVWVFNNFDVIYHLHDHRRRSGGRQHHHAHLHLRHRLDRTSGGQGLGGLHPAALPDHPVRAVLLGDQPLGEGGWLR